MAKSRNRKRATTAARESNQRRLLLIIAGVVAVILVAALIAVNVFATSNTATAQYAGTAVCQPIEFPSDEGRLHLNPGQTPTYNSQPPSSGTHNPIPLPAGVYDSPVDLTMEVHSLEHGYIVIHYNNASPDEVNQLKQIVQADPRKMILAPYSSMTSKISLTAWDKRQFCSGVDRQAILGFVGNYRDKGPENAP